MSKPKSDCCRAPVRVEGNTTQYYLCTKCGKACDLAVPKPKCTCYEPGRITDPKCPMHGGSWKNRSQREGLGN